MRERIQEHPIKYFRGSGESESSAQQAGNRELKPMRGRTQSLQKSWQVFSVALVFSCLVSLRDLSPLNRVIFLRNWVGAANKASPSHLGQRATM
jgi:hypothetical protein